MNDLTIGKTYEYLSNCFDGGKAILNISEADQGEFIRQLRDELGSIENVTANFSPHFEAAPNHLHIIVKSFYQEKLVGEGEFVVGFVKGSDEFSAFARPWSDSTEGYPIHSKAQVIKMIDKIKGTFYDRLSKKRATDEKKRISEQFAIQGLAAQVHKIAEQKKFDFAIRSKYDSLQILIEQDGLGPVEVSMPIDEKEREAEMGKLSEYIDHALVHIHYLGKVSMGYIEYFETDLKWFRNN